MNWENIIKLEKQKDYFINLDKFLNHEYGTKKIYPPKANIFKAFELCKYEDLKVVIIGQDPYHQSLQAQGLAFSTPNHIKNPPSMVNILKEIIDDIGDSNCIDGDLTPWANQGVLLINTILTVEDSSPKSHHKKGWETFTNNIIKHINEHFNNIVFILWGAGAIKMGKQVDEKKHHILTSPHPSPLSSYRGFFGCKHFSKTNKILKTIEKKEIVW